MKQETLDAMRSWLDGETVEFVYGDGGELWHTLSRADSSNSSSPTFCDDFRYRIKPRTIRIGEYDVPEPERKAPAMKTVYYIPFLGVSPPVEAIAWENDSVDKTYLANGMVHLNREAAALHAKALISLTEVEP